VSRFKFIQQKNLRAKKLDALLAQKAPNNPSLEARLHELNQTWGHVEGRACCFWVQSVKIAGKVCGKIMAQNHFLGGPNVKLVMSV
jgi:hypothetical protein